MPKSKVKETAAMPALSPNRSINIKKAENGYVVSCYDNKTGKDVMHIAKDMPEVSQAMKKMMQK